MNKYYLGIIICGLILQGCATTPPRSMPEATSDITFATAEPAPKYFTSWTFYWFMPEIDPGAELEYIVMKPDGSEYFRHKVGYKPAGYSIRSDFSPGLAKTPPDIFFGKNIAVTFRVTKGTIKFAKDLTFAFDVAVKEIRGVRK